MEVIFNQKFSSTRINKVKNYSLMKNKEKYIKKPQTPFNVDAISINPIENYETFITQPKYKNRNVAYFYSEIPQYHKLESVKFLNEKNFYTNKDRHIKKYFNDPFVDIKVNSIYFKIMKNEDKITLNVKIYSKYRYMNYRYFKKSKISSSITFNLKNGNFYVISGKNIFCNHFEKLDIFIRQYLSEDFLNLVDAYKKHTSEYEKILDFVKKETLIKILKKELFNKLGKKSLYDDICDNFIKIKNIKVPDQYHFYLKNYYPTEKFLIKNDRKLLQSILDKHSIKSKLTIKLLHKKNINLALLKNLCNIFGDNYNFYLNRINEDSFNEFFTNAEFSFIVKHKFTNIEKENILKIINNYKIDYNFFITLNDHMDMIKTLSYYDIKLYFSHKTYNDFIDKHLEISKKIRLIKKGVTNEYIFNEKMLNSVETIININNENLYPFILKRDDEYLEEGEFMNHCVYSYAKKDKSIIVSIRTESKQHRATCEFDTQTGNLIQIRYFNNTEPPEKFLLASNVLLEKVKNFARLGMLRYTSKKVTKLMLNGIEVPETSYLETSYLEEVF
jgi:hypothetical protein